MALFDSLREIVHSGMGLFEEVLADVIPKKDTAAKIMDATGELALLTQDSDPEVIQLRALMVYLSIVKHVRSRGQVKFVGIGPDRTLKVHTK